MKAQVEVDVEVEAGSVEEARGKAFSWDSGGANGYCSVGGYTLDDVDIYDDDSEMFWEIQEVEPLDIVEVTVVEDEDAEVLAI